MSVNGVGGPKAPRTTTSRTPAQPKGSSQGSSEATGYVNSSAFEGDTREAQVRDFMDKMKLLRDHGTVTETEGQGTWVDSGTRLTEWGHEQVEQKLEALMKDPPKSAAAFAEKMGELQNWAETNAWMNKNQFETMFKELMGKLEEASRKLHQW